MRIVHRYILISAAAVVAAYRLLSRTADDLVVDANIHVRRHDTLAAGLRDQ
jgi:hypothetical protein